MKRTIQILVSILAIATAGVLSPLGHGGTARAQPSLASAAALTNPLILHNTLTGASAQMMPTTSWLDNHGISYGTHRTSSTGSGSLPAPTCTLGTDSSVGDAMVPVANQPATQNDALDVSAFGLSTTGTSLSGALSTVSLSDGVPVNGSPAPAVPNVTGGGDLWYVVWKTGSDPSILGYYVAASYPAAPTDSGYTNNSSTSNLPVAFTYGYVTAGTGGIQQLNFQGGASGTFDVAHSAISITAPLSALGGLKAGATISGAYAKTQAAVGTTGSGPLFVNVDTVNTGSADYTVGQAQPNCPGAASTGGGSTGPVGNAPSKGSPNNLSYYGGPTIHSVKNYLIWWLPKAGTTTYSDGSSCAIPGTVPYSFEQPASSTSSVSALPGGPDGDTDYTSILTQFFKDETGTAYYNLLSQYADMETGGALMTAGYGGSWTDNCGYTSTVTNAAGTSVTVPGGTTAAPIYQQDIQNEVQRAIQVNKWPDGMGAEYFVFTGANVADCFAPPGQGSATPTCDLAAPVPTYCAYHGDFMDGKGNTVIYADMPSAGTAGNPAASLCWQSPIGVNDPSHTVNGHSIKDTVADAEVAITSHEQFESVSDAQVGTAQQLAPPLGWYDAANGEIGDKCAYIYGHYAGDGSNIDLHGDHYIVQEEYSNWDNGCALTGYQNDGGFGGSGDSIAIQKGWNVIGVPTSGITDASKLVADMTRPGQLPAGSITKVELYHNGSYVTYTPPATHTATTAASSSSTTGSSSVKPGQKPTPTPKPTPKPKPTPSPTPTPTAPPPPSINRTDGVLVYSTAAGTYTPSGAVYTSAPTITLNQGWNLVSMTYPNPGLSTDTIYNQIAAENHACGAAVLTNAACDPTITEIKVTGPSSDSPTDASNTPIVDWKPQPADASGQAQWPQTQGDHIPFTNGLWIYATKSLTWTVQGSECQTVSADGVCS